MADSSNTSDIAYNALEIREFMAEKTTYPIEPKKVLISIIIALIFLLINCENSSGSVVSPDNDVVKL